MSAFAKTRIHDAADHKLPGRTGSSVPESHVVRRGIDSGVWAIWFPKVKKMPLWHWEWTWSHLKHLRMHRITAIIDEGDSDCLLANILSHNVTPVPYAAGANIKISSKEPRIIWKEMEVDDPMCSVLIPLNTKGKASIEPVTQNAPTPLEYNVGATDFLYFDTRSSVTLLGITNSAIFYCILWYGKCKNFFPRPVILVCLFHFCIFSCM